MSGPSAAWGVCPAGHAYTEANTGYDRHGHRWCKACAATRNRRHYYARQGLPVPAQYDRRGRPPGQQPDEQGPPPAEWLDWVVVHRLVTGRGHPGRAPTWAEKRAVTAYLRREGANQKAVARVLRCDVCTVRTLIGEVAAPAAAVAARIRPDAWRPTGAEQAAGVDAA